MFLNSQASFSLPQFLSHFSVFRSGAQYLTAHNSSSLFRKSKSSRAHFSAAWGHLGLDGSRDSGYPGRQHSCWLKGSGLLKWKYQCFSLSVSQLNRGVPGWNGRTKIQEWNREGLGGTWYILDIKSMDFRIRTVWDWILALPLYNCVTFGKLFKLQFLHL